MKTIKITKGTYGYYITYTHDEETYTIIKKSKKEAEKIKNTIKSQIYGNNIQ